MKNIFYGWFMLAGLALMYATTNGVGAYALSVMRPLQIKSFGLDAQVITHDLVGDTSRLQSQRERMRLGESTQCCLVGIDAVVGHDVIVGRRPHA